MTEQNPFESKQRIIQEFVPGKQVTMAHLIANPNEDLYKKLGVVSKTRGALGILDGITPSEAAIIGADVATKAAEVEIVFVDRFSGSLVVCGMWRPWMRPLRMYSESLEKSFILHSQILQDPDENQDLVSWEESYFLRVGIF